jgi:uncharacterized SAM-binding protein YcdF (DUF218 family)
MPTASRPIARRHPFSFILLVAGAGAAACAAVLLVLAAVYSAVERQAARDETRRADAIVVLGSAVRPDGQPSASLRARTQQAIELYRQGYAPTLFLSGGLGRFPPSEAAAMRRLALAGGVPESALVLDETATSTRESVTNAARAAAARGWTSVLVVSEPFHMLRATRMARDAGLAAYAAPARRSPLHTQSRLRRYYTGREALALLWYLAAGRFLPG